MEKEEQYLKERLEEQIVWYDKKSIFCQKCYKYTKIVIGLCAISLSPLAVLKVQYTDSLLVFIGALIAVLEYFLSINHFQEEARIFRGKYTCYQCGFEHDWVAINDDTVVREFSANYYIEKDHVGCCWSEDERYCVLCSYDEFMNNPTEYIEKAFDKRTASIANKVTVYPK